MNKLYKNHMIETPLMLRVKVIGIDEINGYVHNLICFSDIIGEIKIDPFVGNAVRYMIDSEKRKMVGNVFYMREYWKSEDVYLCRKFETYDEITKTL